MLERNNFELIEKEKMSHWLYEYYDEILKIIENDNINNMSYEDYTFYGKRASDGEFDTKEKVWAMLHCAICKNESLRERSRCLYCKFNSL